LDDLKVKSIGECIFRPAPKVDDKIYCTWKFYEFTYAHLIIQEKDKPNPQALGRYFELDSDIFYSLKEIIDTYIQPCNRLVKEACIHPKFKPTSTFSI